MSWHGLGWEVFCLWGKTGVQDSAPPAFLPSCFLFEASAGVKRRGVCVCAGELVPASHMSVMVAAGMEGAGMLRWLLLGF